MTPKPITVLPDTAAADALWLMDDHHFRNLPVIDRQGQILGDMTYASIIHYLAARYPVEVLNQPPRPEQYPSKPEGGD
jgi:CBS-domain-containing membrane protein